MLNSPLVNVDNSHISANFSSNVNPRLVAPSGLGVQVNNIQGANSELTCLTGGGRKKNIFNMYRRKMHKGSRSRRRKLSKLMRRIRRTKRIRKLRGRHQSKKYRQKGGYQNNMPMTQTYETGGKLSASESALANPVPYKTLSNCTNCIDNFNKNSMTGFPSKGWW
jgi:hypothetical protein